MDVPVTSVGVGINDRPILECGILLIGIQNLISELEGPHLDLHFFLPTDTNSWRLHNMSFCGRACVRQLDSPFLQPRGLLGDLLSELLNYFIPHIWVESCVPCDLRHELVIVLRFLVKSSHSAELRDQINRLVISISSNNERLPGVMDLKSIVLLVVVNKTHLQAINFASWGFGEINISDFVDPVVSIGGYNGSSFDGFLDEGLVFSVLFHLVDVLEHVVAAEDSAGEINEELDFVSLVEVDGGFVARPDLEMRVVDNIFELFGF